MEQNIDQAAQGFYFLGQLMVWGALAMLLASPVCSAIVARTKGRSPTNWFVLGLVFGPFGLIAAAGAAPFDAEADRARRGALSQKRLCPACHEPMWLEATACPHCTTQIEYVED